MNQKDLTDLRVLLTSPGWKLVENCMNNIEANLCKTALDIEDKTKREDAVYTARGARMAFSALRSVLSQAMPPTQPHEFVDVATS